MNTFEVTQNPYTFTLLPPPSANFLPLRVTSRRDDGPIVDVLKVHEDGSVEANWPALEAYVAEGPLSQNQAFHDHFLARCIAHAVLAVRDGRVKEIAQ